MKAVWAVCAIVTQLASSSQLGFNVYDDPYAYPQYEVVWKLDLPVSEEQAEAQLRADLSIQNSPLSHDVKQLRHSTDNNPLLNDETFSAPVISSYEAIQKDNQRYLCAIPYVQPLEGTASQTNRTAEEEEKELALATQRGWELLKGMEGNCIYFVSGWWSYSFCYNEGVRQFHPLPGGRNVPIYPPVEDKSVAAYVLGRFEGSEVSQKEDEEEIDDEESLKTQKGAIRKEKPKSNSVGKLAVKGQSRYLVQHLAGGTVCDLTGEERSIEVQFRCDSTPTDRISLIKETSICQYRMVISTPRLCNDVAFHPPKVAAPHPITCHPIMSEESISAYLEIRATESKAEKAEAEKLANTIAQEILNEFKAIMGGGSTKSEGKDKDDTKDVAKEREAEAAVKPKKPRKNIIAGIEVGGHNILPEGTKLEKGAVVGGGTREKVLATIARSDGYVADERELAKLNIKYGKELDTIKQEVERVAEGAEWQIDVVETTRGKELRGIIGDPKKKESTKKSSVASKKGQQPEQEEDAENGEAYDAERSFDDSEDEWDDGSEEGFKEDL